MYSSMLRRVDDAAVGQHPAGLRREERMLVEERHVRPTAASAVVAVLARARARPGIVAGEARASSRRVRPCPSVTLWKRHAGAAGQLDVDHRLGRAQADAADLDHVGLDLRARPGTARTAVERLAGARRPGRRCPVPTKITGRSSSLAAQLGQRVAGAAAGRRRRRGRAGPSVRQATQSGQGWSAPCQHCSQHLCSVSLAIVARPFCGRHRGSLSTVSGVTPAWNSPLTLITGARPQAPMQATTSRLNSPSRVVWPGSIFSSRLTASSTAGRALHVAGRAAADLDVELALRLEAELVVEGRHAVDLAGRQAAGAGRCATTASRDR